MYVTVGPVLAEDLAAPPAEDDELLVFFEEPLFEVFPLEFPLELPLALPLALPVLLALPLVEPLEVVVDESEFLGVAALVSAGVETFPGAEDDLEFGVGLSVGLAACATLKLAENPRIRTAVVRPAINLDFELFTH